MSDCSTTSSPSSTSAIIFGAGQAGLAAYQQLKNDYCLLGFCDNDKHKQGTQLLGLTIFSPQQLASLSVDQILVASEYAERIQQQLTALNLSTKVVILPARLIKSVHFADNPQLAPMAVKILHVVCAALQRNTVSYYVDAGTLLGIYRDNALIPWDDDLDLAIKAEEVEQVIDTINGLLPDLHHLTDQEWALSRQYASQDFGAVSKGAIRAMKLHPLNTDSSLPMMDLFVKYIQAEWMDYCLASRGIRMPSKHFNHSVEHHFAGQSVMLPAEVESYLERHYGDWRSPKKDWGLNELNNATLF